MNDDMRTIGFGLGAYFTYTLHIPTKLDMIVLAVLVPEKSATFQHFRRSFVELNIPYHRAVHQKRMTSFQFLGVGWLVGWLVGCRGCVWFLRLTYVDGRFSIV